MLVAFIAGAVPLAAQEAASCSTPGAAFGITSYQCASCSVNRAEKARVYATFQAEPVVLEAAKSSGFQAGDVIEAVNGEPITTSAGSTQFTYPPAGKSTVAVRRGNSRVQVQAMSPGCADAPAPPSAPSTPLVIVDGATVTDLNQVASGTIESIDVLKGPAAMLYGPRAANGVILITTKRGTPGSKPAAQATPKTEPVIIIDGVPQATVPKLEENFFFGGRRFGFALACSPSCTRARTADGAEYYKFDGYPPIVAVTDSGPAARAGLRVGDLITQIDGKSILAEEGALRFFRSNRSEAMSLTVVRDRLPISFVLSAR
jgi:TonB-dependent SusC/RagA subfamily outer membrane receptor